MLTVREISLQKMELAMGQMPDENFRRGLSLAMDVKERREFLDDGYTQIAFYYQVDEKRHVPAYLLIPTKSQFTRPPLILVLSGSGLGKEQSVGEFTWYYENHKDANGNDSWYVKATNGAHSDYLWGSSDKFVLSFVDRHDFEGEEFAIAEAIGLSLHGLDFVVCPLQRAG